MKKLNQHLLLSFTVTIILIFLGCYEVALGNTLMGVFLLIVNSGLFGVTLIVWRLPKILQKYDDEVEKMNKKMIAEMRDKFLEMIREHNKKVREEKSKEENKI